MAGKPDPEDPGTLASTQDKAAAPEAAPVAIRASELQTVDPAHYARHGEHARGGLGRILDAHDRRLDRRVAIKELLLAGPAQEARFVREALVTARLQHPGIVPVYEAGRWPDGEPFYAMKMVSGRSLRDLIVDARTLEQRLALVPNVLAVADAVAYAHHAGIIHRDLKPSNVVVGPFGETLVIDWGLAKDLGGAPEEPEVGAYRVAASDLTVMGAVMGTPEYMPPEQARGDPVDERADVYALGAILYHVLSGRAPFTGEGTAAVLEQVRHGPPPPLERVQAGAPADLLDIAAKAMARAREDRYATAREMAEDLRRFQTGQLVAAHRYSARERLRRLLRRHRSAATAAAIGLVVAALLLGLWQRARRSASEQAVLAQRFGQDVEQIDSALRQAYLLPLHDVRAEKALVRSRMGQIEASMQAAPAGAGPGNYALGRGHLALHEYQRARERLEAAWNAGYRPPEVAFALGQAMGGQYQEALAAVDSIADAELRASRRRDLDATYREPALQYLKAGPPALGGAAAYVEGLIAFYDRRFDDARRGAGRALAAAPGLYEAWQLEGDALAARGAAEAESGPLAPALQTLDAAGAAYHSGIVIARSHPGLLEAECRRLVKVAVAQGNAGAPAEDTYQRAISACAEALQADPEDVSVLSTAALCHGEWAESLLWYGRDPTPRAAEAAALAERAVALDPRHTVSYVYLGEADLVRAGWQARHGGDPRPLLDRAMASFRRANALLPQPETYNGLGRAAKIKALYELGHGIDPRASANEGVASYEQELKLKPRYGIAYSNLGNQWELIAEYELKTGTDPHASVARATEAYEQALALDPKLGFVHNNLGAAQWCDGAFEYFQGADPTPAARRAIDSYERGIAFDPKQVDGYVNAGQARRLIAAYLVEQGRDPRPMLDESRRDLAQAMRVDPGLDLLYVEAAETELVAARWAIREGQPPEGSLGALKEWIDRGAAVNRQNADFPRLEADLHRQRAEWWQRAGKPSRAEVDRGLAAAERALAINPGSAETMATRGVLWLLAARAESAGDGRVHAALQARDSMERALAVNSLLRREYGPFLESARRLAE